MENTKREKEITLSYIMKVLKKSAVWMVLAAMLLGALAAVYATFWIKPTYRGTATFWITNTSSSYDYTSQAQTGAASNIASNCVDLADEDMPVRKAVVKHNLAEKLGYSDVDSCVKSVRRMITAGKNDSDGFIFYISATTSSPEDTLLIISAIQDVMPEVLEELGLRQNADKSPITVIGPVNGTKDISTIKSSPVTYGIGAAFAGALLVFAAIFIISLLDTVIYGSDMLKENFDHPVIGSIPTWESPTAQSTTKRRRSFNLRRRHIDVIVRDYKDKLLTSKSPFAVTEAFNTLRTNVIFSANAAKNPVFAVTSARTAEGKSFMSANLALSLSFLEKKVLLVECDMRCPSFYKMFSMKVEEGVAELLAGMVDSSEQVTKRIKDTGLDVIFCGKIPPNPSELLSSVRMQELIEQWRSKYDYIILDMPPVCEVADAGVVSPIVNGYIITVRCDFSDIDEVDEAMEGLKSVGGNIMGLVLNDVNIKNSSEYNNEYRKLYRKKATFKANGNTN